MWLYNGSLLDMSKRLDVVVQWVNTGHE